MAHTPVTLDVCGLCGEARPHGQMGYVKANTKDGYVAIRCPEHPHAERNARAACRRHQARIAIAKATGGK